MIFLVQAALLAALTALFVFCVYRTAPARHARRTSTT